jgi:redox-sensitive bicupin YhaK (pirin superfamily)
MTQRTILDILKAPVSRHGSALTTRDATEQVLGADMDPFIVVSLYDMVGPTFPPHPHAGFAVATYILPESQTGFINQDSIGNSNAIPPGALHVTVAGSGVIHEEQPQETGVLARGYQIWIDLANGSRAVTPHAVTLQANQVPVLVKNGAIVRSVLGNSNGLESPLKLATDVRLIDVALEPDATFSQNLATSENAFILILDGAAVINTRQAETGDLIRTAPDGDTLDFVAGKQGARFTLFAGQPLRQSRAQRGPMVAGDQAELNRFMTAYKQGQFGPLQPFSQQAATR